MSARNHSWLVVAGLWLTGLTMRTAVTSVGAALDDLQDGLHASAAVAGLITTLPVVCFAGVGAVTPRLSRSLGSHRLLVYALLVSALALLAALPWFTTLRGDHGLIGTTGGSIPLGALARSRTAWALTAFFAAQSTQAYIGFDWFARFLVDHGITHATAGAMLASLTAVGIPVSLVAPRVPAAKQRYLVVFFGLCSVVAYVGLAVAPVGGAWVWMVLVGVGYGVFPVSLLLIALRTREAATTAALSAFVQVIGYVVAGCGPLLFGALFGATGSWGLPLTVLFVALAISIAASWPSTADRYVDDELAASRA